MNGGDLVSNGPKVDSSLAVTYAVRPRDSKRERGSIETEMHKPEPEATAREPLQIDENLQIL